MSIKYAVIFERALNNWAANVPDLPGCTTTASTLEETKANIREAGIGERHLKKLSLSEVRGERTLGTMMGTQKRWVERAERQNSQNLIY